MRFYASACTHGRARASKRAFTNVTRAKTMQPEQSHQIHHCAPRKTDRETHSKHASFFFFPLIAFLGGGVGRRAWGWRMEMSGQGRRGRGRCFEAHHVDAHHFRVQPSCLHYADSVHNANKGGVEGLPRSRDRTMSD